MTRTTAAQRAKSSIRAEREIMKFALPDSVTGIRPHALWHKYVHNVELDPIQILKMQEMDEQAPPPGGTPARRDAGAADLSVVPGRHGGTSGSAPAE